MAIPLRPRSERGALAGTPAVFGTSVLGAPLHVWRASAPPSGVLVVAGVHGEEGEGTTLLSAALRSLPERRLAADVVLGLNPDGLALGTRGNARGVDLNRNFPTSDWSPAAVCHRWTLEEERDVELSPGTAAASEPETRAFLGLLADRRPRLVLALHAPLACVDDPAHTRLGRWLADRTGLARVGDVGYPTPGSLGTWGRQHDLPVVTWELEREASEVLVQRHLATLVEILARDAPGGDAS